MVQALALWRATALCVRTFSSGLSVVNQAGLWPASPASLPWSLFKAPAAASSLPSPPSLLRHFARRATGQQNPRHSAAGPEVPAVITARVAAAPSLEDLQEVLHLYRDQLNCIHLSAGFTKLAKLPPSSNAQTALLKQVAASLSQKLVASADDVGTRELANVVWSLGKLSKLVLPSPDLLSALVAKSCSSEEGHLQRASPQQLSSLAYGFTCLGCKQPELWGVIWAAMDSKLHLFEPRQLANALWSLGKAGFRDASATDKLLTAINKTFSSVDRSTYLQLAWSIAELSPKDCQLAPVLAAACARDVRLLDQRTLTQAIHMCAKVQLKDTAAIHRLLTAVLRMPERFSAFELAMIIRAAATLQYRDATTVAKLLQAGVKQARRLPAQQVTTLITSVAKLGYLPQEVTGAALGELIKALQPRIQDLSAADVSGCLSSCAKLLHCRDDGFIFALCDAAVPLAPAMNAQMLSNVLWACVTLWLVHPDLLQAVEAAITEGELQLTGQSLAVSVWAASQLYPTTGPLMSELVTRVRSEVSRLHAMDIVQVAFALAQAHVRDPELYHALLQRSSQQLQAFDAHMLVSLAASLQRTHALTREFMAEVEQQWRTHPDKWPAEDVTKLQHILAAMDAPAAAAST